MNPPYCSLFVSPRNAARLVALIFILPPFVGQAQSPPQDAPPVDARAILGSLKAIKEQQSRSLKDSQNRVLQQVLAAAGDSSAAVATYMKAVQISQFGGDGAQAVRFTEWMKKQGNTIRSPDFQTALHLHLIYLALTLERSSGVEVKALLPQLLEYTGAVAAYVPQSEPAEALLKRPLSDSPFTKYFEAGSWVNPQDWEQVPGNIDGIFTQTILPEMRRTKDPALLSYWDDRMQREAADATRSHKPLAVDQFNLIQRPTLLWNQSQDMLVLGEKNRSISSMYNVIRGYPNHPNFSQWTSRLEEVLQGSLPPQAPSAAPTPAWVPPPSAARQPTP